VKSLENTYHNLPERFCGGDSVQLQRGAISSVCTFTFYLYDECMVLVSFSSCARHLFAHCRPRSRHMVPSTEGDWDWERPVCVDIWCVAGLLGCVSAPSPQPQILQCVCTSSCNCHVFGRYFAFLAAYSVM